MSYSLFHSSAFSMKVFVLFASAIGQIASQPKRRLSQVVCKPLHGKSLHFEGGYGTLFASEEMDTPGERYDAVRLYRRLSAA
jgi:hypothetical protein